MKKQKVMSQMKGQDKIPLKKQLNELETGNLPEKRIQNSDCEDDLGSQEKNGGKGWEGARNVYQRLTRANEQTNRDE